MQKNDLVSSRGELDVEFEVVWNTATEINENNRNSQCFTKFSIIIVVFIVFVFVIVSSSSSFALTWVVG